MWVPCMGGRVRQFLVEADLVEVVWRGETTAIFLIMNQWLYRIVCTYIQGFVVLWTHVGHVLVFRSGPGGTRSGPGGAQSDPGGARSAHLGPLGTFCSYSGVREVNLDHFGESCSGPSSWFWGKSSSYFDGFILANKLCCLLCELPHTNFKGNPRSMLIVL